MPIKYKNIELYGIMKGDTGAKIVSTAFQGKDENGGNIYLQTFDDGSTATFVAPKGDNVTIDKALSSESENPVQNKVVNAAIDTAQNTANTAKATADEAQSKANSAYSLASNAFTRVVAVEGKVDAAQNTANEALELAQQGGGESITVDGELSTESENPVQNKVIAQAIDELDARVGEVENEITNIDLSEYLKMPTIRNYGDGKIASKTESGDDRYYQVYGNANMYSIPLRDDKGCVKTKSPNTELDCANKEYVDKTTKFYLHKIHLTYTQNNVSDNIEASILSKQSTQFVLGEVIADTFGLLNKALSSVFYIKNEASNQIANETSRFSFMQISETAYEVYNLAGDIIGTIDTASARLYDNVIDL